MTERDEIFTVREAAQVLKISVAKCYEWTHIEGFPCVKVGNIRRIPRALLLDWMNGQAQLRPGEQRQPAKGGGQRE